MKLIFAFVAIVAVSARPDGSPLCDVNGAAAQIAAGPMGANKNDLKAANLYTFTADSKDLTPGKTININVAGPAFDGFLMYATGTDTNSRIGKFSTAQGSHPCTGCNNFKLDDPTSVLTQSANAKFSGPTSFQYTVPAGGFTGSIAVNAIILQKLAAGGFAWGVYPGAVTLGAAQDQASSNSPQQGVPPPPPAAGAYTQKGVQSVVADSQSQCPPVQTVTVTMTAAPIVKIRKCRPKNLNADQNSITPLTYAPSTQTNEATPTPTQSVVATQDYKLPPPPAQSYVANSPPTPTQSVVATQDIKLPPPPAQLYGNATPIIKADGCTEFPTPTAPYVPAYANPTA